MAEIKVISNSDKNHLEELRGLIQSNADRLIIASPFLASSITELLNEFSFDNIKNIDLITTFKPEDIEQLTKPAILKEFFDYFNQKYPTMSVKIHVDNCLHGKLYVSVNGLDRRLILGSANFTRNGLCNNHEWGIAINDNSVIDAIVEELFDSIEYPEITFNQIKRACLFADQYKREHPDWIKKPNVFSNILEDVYSVEDKYNTEPKYFLKPIGVTESPVLLKDQRDFSAIHQNLHFSKKRPTAVRKGDILITVAVTAGSLLSYYKVTGGVQHVTEEEIKKERWKERWPWYVEGRNQSPEFGGQWWIHNIQRKDVLDEFLEKYPNSAVTCVGTRSLGTLNYGGDKVRITREFGEFLISKFESASK